MAESHTHDDHAPIEDIDRAPTKYEILEQTIRELLIEKKVLTADAIRGQMEDMESRSPEKGAEVVVRAWTDPQFKALLLRDGTAAVETMGVDMSHAPKLAVVENTAEVHNVIVCTLCSCYPRKLLGIPPAWYKSHAYRSRAVIDPRAVLRDFGTELPEEVEIRVVDSTADLRYMVLPMRPAGTDDLSAPELVKLVNRDSMIGVAQARDPSSPPHESDGMSSRV
jgi:nitrile hydratase alpha subunit